MADIYFISCLYSGATTSVLYVQTNSIGIIYCSNNHWCRYAGFLIMIIVRLFEEGDIFALAGISSFQNFLVDLNLS